MELIFLLGLKPAHSSNDLVLQPQQILRCRDDPKKVVQIFWIILRAFDPTWADVQPLFEVVFALTKCIKSRSVIKEGEEAAGGKPWPMADPEWDHSTEAVRNTLRWRGDGL